MFTEGWLELGGDEYSELFLYIKYFKIKDWAGDGRKQEIEER